MSKARLLACLRAAVIIGMTAAASGCVSPGGYFTDRWHDAKDIFTASVGVGGGAKARVGPLNAGLFLNEDRAGLRGGECFYHPHSFLEGGSVDGVLLLIYNGEIFDLSYRPPPRSEEVWPRVRVRYPTVGDALAERNKSFESVICPPWAFKLPKAPYYYTQLEVAAGVGGTVRLGFNPGELVDFVFGWFGLDIFGDDLEARRESEEAEKKAKEKPSQPPAPPAPNAPTTPQGRT